MRGEGLLMRQITVTFTADSSCGFVTRTRLYNNGRGGGEGNEVKKTNRRIITAALGRRQIRAAIDIAVNSASWRHLSTSDKRDAKSHT